MSLLFHKTFQFPPGFCWCHWVGSTQTSAIGKSLRKVNSGAEKKAKSWTALPQGLGHSLHRTSTATVIKFKTGSGACWEAFVWSDRESNIMKWVQKNTICLVDDCFLSRSDREQYRKCCSTCSTGLLHWLSLAVLPHNKPVAMCLWPVKTIHGFDRQVGGSGVSWDSEELDIMAPAAACGAQELKFTVNMWERGTSHILSSESLQSNTISQSFQKSRKCIYSFSRKIARKNT